MFETLKNFDENKAKLIEKIKPLAIAASCMAVVFTAGFGAGNLQSGTSGNADATKRSLSSNYTTNNGEQTNSNSTKNSNKSADSATTTVPKTSTTSGDACTTIKGSKSKIYHVPGGSFYDRTNAAQCFTTEEEAVAAGFTKSSR